MASKESGRRYLNYKEATDLVEEFMKESRIRLYCETICKGECCGLCYTSKNACHKHEGRRIACSIFICPSLAHLVFIQEIASLRNEIKNKIDNALEKAEGIAKWGYMDYYHRPYSKSCIENFKLYNTKSLLKELNRWSAYVAGRTGSLVALNRARVKQEERIRNDIH